MTLENLKQFQLSKEELKTIKGSNKNDLGLAPMPTMPGRDIYCITLHKGICEKKSFCSESAELTNSWAYVWEGFGWSTESNCRQI